MIDPAIKNSLLFRFPNNLVDELIQCYIEQKKNFYLGRMRPNEVEGGRFAEAAFRMLQHAAGFAVTPLGTQLDTDGIIRSLANLPFGSAADSIRLHIPRSLRVVYDIRNKRDAAHLADGIDPNLQDGTLVISILDWVLAEFVRIYHNISASESQKIVDGLVTRQIPAVEEINGFLKILNPTLKVSGRVL